jgi:dCMP deaminase
MELAMSKSDLSLVDGAGKKQPNRRRTDQYIDDWDDYFLSISKVIALKSKDPDCRVGAIVTSSDNLIISTGFNGLARGAYDTDVILNKTNEKLLWICHAEFNAVVNASRMGIALKGASIYVTKFPCLSCCNAIIQAGIERICTHDNRYWDDDPLDGVKKSKPHSRKIALLKQSGIHIDAPYHPDYKPKVRII